MKFNNPCIGVIYCQKGNIPDFGDCKARVTKHIMFWGNAAEGTPVGGVAEGAKILVVCGSGVENKSAQTLSCAVSLHKDKAGNAHQ